jgi:hypothetical protein
MLHRALALVVCALCQPTFFVPPRALSPPVACLAGVRDSMFDGDMMSSLIRYSTVLPVVAARNLPLGTLVDIRLGGRVTRGIVLDNRINLIRVDVELSPVLSRRMGALQDGFQPVTLEVVGYEPRSRWIYAIGTLTQHR